MSVLGVGGGGRAALTAARAAAGAREGLETTIASLRPADPPMRAATRAAGFQLLDAVPLPELLEAMERADLVHLHFWNSPELAVLLEAEPHRAACSSGPMSRGTRPPRSWIRL
jgi:hypothetical protein